MSQELSDVAAALVGCRRVSGALRESGPNRKHAFKDAPLSAVRSPPWIAHRFKSVLHAYGRAFCHPCFAMRLGGVSGGKEIQGWRDSSHTPIVGAGKLGSAKLPIATATYPGKPSPSQ